MKTFTRIFAIVLAVFMLFAFAACNNSDGGSSSTASTEKKVLKVATNAEFPPFEDLDENNNVVGFDADLIKAIAEKMDMTVEFSNMEFDGVLAAIASGTCDVAISGLTINDKRKESVDFSEPYHETAQIIIVRQDDEHFTGTTKEEIDEQLKNQKIGVCAGFTGEAYAKGDEDWGYTAIEGADIKSYDNISLAITDLNNGTINVIIMDAPTAKESADSDANKDKVKVIDIPLTVEYYGIAVKKGNSEMLDKINDALAEIKEENKLDSFKDTWGIK